MKKLFMVESTVKKYGKPDVERIGIFIEMPYMPAKGPAPKGKQAKAKAPALPEVLPRMLAGGNKTRCGNMDGYFSENFIRIFAGERPKKQKKVIPPAKLPFIPAGSCKKLGFSGDYTGTFGGHITAFSRRTRPKPKYKTQLPNPLTRPGKKGGPGYIDITIGKYPEHKSDRPKFKRAKKEKGIKKSAMITMHFPQPYFDKNPHRDPQNDPPNKRLYIKPKEKPLDKRLKGRPQFIPTGPGKWIGGSKAGCFSKWPEWVKERFMTPEQIAKFVPVVIKKKGKKVPEPKMKSTPFSPQAMALKRMFTVSTLYKTKFSMNATNWKTYEPTYIKHLLKNVY